MFKKCKKNRSKENYFFNNACVSFGNKKEFINFTYQNLNSFSSEIIDEEIKNQYLSNPILLRGEKSFTFSAKAMTLNSILDQSNAPDIIDFFSLDTEGGEFEVLEGIDFERYKFKYMLIETNDFERLKKYLTNKNYIFIEKLNLNDYLFKLN